jgi:hypothetical protein
LCEMSEPGVGEPGAAGIQPPQTAEAAVHDGTSSHEA